MRHSVHVAKPCPGESQTGKIASRHHVTGCVKVAAVGDKPADTSADQFKSFLRHGIGKWVRPERCIGFPGMDHRVYPAGGGNSGRRGHDKLRIEDGKMGENLVAVYSELIISGSVRDD